MLKIVKLSFVSAALLSLVACGGSGNSASELVVANPFIEVDDTTNEQQGNVGDEVEIVVTSQADSSVLTQRDSDQPLSDAGTNVSDTETTTETATETETVITDALQVSPDTPSDQFCQPVSTSVTYENYCHVSSSCIAPDGQHVPVPAAGFGWDGTQMCDLSASHGVDVVEVLVPFVRKNADIDGRPEPNWSNAARAGTSNHVVSRNDIDNLMLSPVPGYLDGAGYSTWSAMHDGTNLYLWIRVSSEFDNVPFIDSPGRPWFDDSIEIFIDGDNSKGIEYDGIDDFQAILLAHSSTDWQPAISESSASGLGIFYRTSSNVAILNYEVAINLESAGIIPGRPFGFDVQINEDDNGGDRDAKWGWFEQSGFDRSYLRPDVFGTLVLTECDDPVTCGSHQILSR